MAVCGTCGRDNPAEARFCMNCAAPLAPAGPAREVRKTITVVFTDLVGSTALGERLDPETVSRIAARYFERMKAVLERHGGAVEKYIGDAVVATFGIPVAHEDDALRAVRAAAEMREELAALNEDLEARWGVRLAARTGVNTGEVLARTTTEAGVAATGDAMNVGARLEQAAGPGEIVIGEATHRLVHDDVEVEPLDPLALKGKAEAVGAYRLLRLREEGDARSPHTGGPMVGRQDDVALLRSAFRRARDQRSPRMVSVLGPAGAGKSRLVAEFLGELDHEPLVLRGRCLPYGEGITFWPVAEMVRDAAGLVDADTGDEALAKLEVLLADEPDGHLVASRIGAAIGVAPAAIPAEEIGWAVRRLIGSLARRRPVVLVLDDIQWAKPAFLDLVERLPSGVEGPVLVVCMARVELLDVRPGWGQGPASSIVPLAPLANLESELLLENLLGTASELVPTQRVLRAAEGNPLYLEQMATMLLERTAVGGDEDASMRIDLMELEAPPTIQALLASRLDRLELAEREVLERAAVVGEVFEWSAVAELSPAEVRPELGRIFFSLVRKELIRPERSDVASQDAFRFHHLLLRDETYRGIPREGRADLHERFAAWLQGSVETQATEYEEIVGYHLERAHENRSALGLLDEHTRALSEQAAEHLGSAGHLALARGDLSSARKLLDRANRLSPEPSPRTLRDLALAQWEGGELPRSDATFEMAITAARSAGDRDTEWRALIDREGLRLQQARGAGAQLAALDVARRAIPVFEELGDETGLARSWLVIGEVHNHVGEHAEMLAAARQAMEHARRAGNVALEMWAQTQVSSALTSGPSPVAEGMQVAGELVEASAGSPLAQATALRVLCQMKIISGELDEARALSDRINATYEEFGRTLNLATHLGFVTGQLEMRAENWAHADTALRRSCELLEQMGEHGWLSTIVALWAETLFELGRDDDAYLRSERSEELAAPEDQASQIMWRTGRARVLARRGRGDEAWAMVEEAVRIADSTQGLVWQADAYAAQADVARMRADRGAEEQALREALRRYEAKGMPIQVGRVRDRLAELAPA